ERVGVRVSRRESPHRQRHMSSTCPHPTLSRTRERGPMMAATDFPETAMPQHDLVIRNGTVVTAADTVRCDVGIANGTIATLGTGIAAGAREIDASGKLVLPGGVDSHCHIEQQSSGGILCADDFYSATVAAAFGGTTTVIPFAAQHRGQSLREVVRN